MPKGRPLRQLFKIAKVEPLEEPEPLIEDNPESNAT